MGLHDKAFLPFRDIFSTTFLKNCGRGERLRTTTYHKTVTRVKQSILNVKYFGSNKYYFLYQSNFMELIRLLQS